MAKLSSEKGYRPRVIVKLHPHVRFDAKSRVTAETFGLAAEGRGLTMRPLFAPKKAKMEELEKRAAENDPTYRGAPQSYWVVEVPTGVDPQELARKLSAAHDVEKAYVEGGPTPPPLVDPTDDPRWAQQGYLDAAPDGIDAEYAWPRPSSGFTGGDGAGVQVVDLEQGWTLNHEDLTAAAITLISGLNNAYFGHGTAVLGEIRADDNNLGCVGIAPAAGMRVVSQWRTSTTYSTAEAIVDAAAVLSFGDVLLLEAQTTMTGWSGYLPVEVEDAVYDAIRLATALGVVVVEAGANGGIDLDTYTDSGGNQILNRASASFRDSGAIMVGAASSATPHTPMGWSSHGSRIDCYGWGENINTTGDGWTGTATNLYTTSFGGTSGASPMVTGAALIVQGIAQATLGMRFSPLQIRQMLSDPLQNTPSAAPATDRIGVMPNLRNIIDNVIGVIPDVYLRDFVGDTGDPHTGPISTSPDIIVRPSPAIASPQAAFGQGSGTENNDALGYEVEDNFDNYVYVRVRNRGGSAATSVSATVYWSPVATLVSPNLWNLIGTVPISSVPMGDILTVSNGLLWPAASVPATGHYCFVGIIGTANDPAPGPADFVDWTNFERFIRDNNNVTWRNFNVVNNVPPAAGPNPPGFIPLPFLITGPADRARRMKIEADIRLPKGGEVMLDLPRQIADPFYRELTLINARGFNPGRAVARLKPHGVQRIGELLFPARMAEAARLLVNIPKKMRDNEYDVVVRQTHEGREVGRITWRLTPKVQERPKK